jgi:HSP20 family molecular chaperone IbpA
MIDDDFDKLVRSIFEQFFGNSLPTTPQDSRIRLELTPRSIEPPEMDMSNDAHVDTIDLDNEYLVLIETSAFPLEPEARVEGDSLYVRVNSTDEKGVKVSLPRKFDLNSSSLSYKNGVVEIRLAESLRTDSYRSEGTIKSDIETE